MSVRLRRVGPGFNPVPSAVFLLARELLLFAFVIASLAYLITRDNWLRWLFPTQLLALYFGALAIHVAVDDLKQAIQARRMYR